MVGLPPVRNLHDKIEELKCLLIDEVGPSVRNVQAGDLLSKLLDSEQRLRFWQALEHLGHNVQPLYFKRTWRDYFLKVTGSSRYQQPPRIHVRHGSDSLSKIASQNLQFNLADYRKGLWPYEAIEARVIQIIADCMGVPANIITKDTKLADLESL